MNSVILTTPFLLLLLLALAQGAALGEIAAVLLLETAVCLLSGKGGAGG